MTRTIAVSTILLTLAMPALAQDSLNCRQRSYWEPPNGGSRSRAVAVDTSRALAFIHVWERSGGERGNYDYDRVYLLDVSDPDQPLPVGPSLRFPGEVFRMHYEAGLLYVVSSAPVGDVLWLYDVTDPVHPELLGHYDIPDAEEAYGLAVSGDLVFVVVPSTPGGDVRVISVSDPRNPVEIAAWSLPGYAFDIAIAGNLAFITGFMDSLFWVVDITAPQSPVVLGSTRLSEAGLCVAVAGNYAYLSGDKLFVVDVSRPQSPVEVGSHPVRFESYYLAARDNLVYLPAGGAGLRVFDVSDPEDPTEVGFHSGERPYCWDVAISGNLAFVADGSLRIVEFLGAGVEEQVDERPRFSGRGPTVIRGSLSLPQMTNDQFPMTLLDAAGREVMALQPGENDVRRLAPGVYFVRQASGVMRDASSVRKVVIQR